MKTVMFLALLFIGMYMCLLAVAVCVAILNFPLNVCRSSSLWRYGQFVNTNGQFDIHLVAQHCSCYIANVSYMPSTKVECIYASDSSSSSDSDDTDTGECSFASSYICTNQCIVPYVPQGVAALSLSVPVVVAYQPAMCAMGCLTVQMAATKLGVAVIAANIPATVVFVFHTHGCVMGGMTVVTSVTNFSVIFLR